jgi:hypothetical protein
MEQIVGLLVNLNQNLIFSPLLTIVLETMAPSCTIFDIPTNQTSIPAWEKLVVLYQT